LPFPECNFPDYRNSDSVDTAFKNFSYFWLTNKGCCEVKALMFDNTYIYVTYKDMTRYDVTYKDSTYASK